MGLAYVGSSVVAIWVAFATREPHHWGQAHSTLYIILTIAAVGLGVLASYFSFRGARNERERVTEACRNEVLASWEGGMYPVVRG